MRRRRPPPAVQTVTSRAKTRANSAAQENRWGGMEGPEALGVGTTWLRRAVDLAVGPYEEITDFMKRFPDQIEAAFSTLSYFDNMNLAGMVSADHAYYSVGLWDNICPPSTVFASYNWLPDGVKKAIEVYPYNGHEGGSSLHLQRKLQWLREVFG